MSLLTEREAQLVLSSAPRNLSELSQRELRSRIQRARRLMEKYQDEARRQQRVALGKKEPTRSRRAEGDLNTRRKAEYFALTLERFEKRLALLERKERVGTRAVSGTRSTQRATRRAPARVAKTGRKPVQRKRAAGRTATASRSVSGKNASRQKRGGALKQQRAPAVKRQAHARARGQRTQARRDQRR